MFRSYGYGSKPLVPLVNPKIAGKWMFIPLKMVSIGIDPYPYSIMIHIGVPVRKPRKPTNQRLKIARML